VDYRYFIFIELNSVLIIDHLENEIMGDGISYADHATPSNLKSRHQLRRKLAVAQ
jgi:hypothetical protein